MEEWQHTCQWKLLEYAMQSRSEKSQNAKLSRQQYAQVTKTKHSKQTPKMQSNC